MLRQTCADCQTPFASGDPVHQTESGPVCGPCRDLREMAFGNIATRRADVGGVRRGPRHLISPDVATRITMSRSDGTAGPPQPILEISTNGFRVGATRQHEIGERLSCAAVIPGKVALPAQFDVEVRWCRRENADRFEIGVEVAADDVDRYTPLYRTLLQAIGAA